MAEPRTGKALLAATLPFETESVARSWFHLVTTFMVYGTCIWLVFWTPLWIAIPASIIAGLTQLRIFALFHDHLHGALLAKSKPTKWIMELVGLHVLAPRSVWKETHDFHHRNNGKLQWTAVGSNLVLTEEQWDALGPAERKKYLWGRHPFPIFFGYVFVMMAGMCIAAYRRAPKRHWGGPVALAIHFGLVGLVTWQFGFVTALLAIVVPSIVDHMLVAYLFYAQHNFPETRYYTTSEWDYTDAALHGSSYMVMGPLMNWFTANLGYHHIHHLNARIPFYRLPEAMAAVPELQSPNRTSLRPRDVMACLRLKTWDAAARRMVPKHQ